MTTRRPDVVTLALLAIALAAALAWARSFWVNDIWEKKTWVSSAHRNDWVTVASIAGRVHWGRGSMVFTSPEQIAVYDANAARFGTPRWDYAWRGVDSRDRNSWLLPEWKRLGRTTSDWSMTAATVNVPYWPLVAGAWWVAGVRTRNWARLRRWQREGRCLSCGYDLRATPGTCPECGTVPSA